MHAHIDDVPAVEMAPGVVERVLMGPDQSNPLARVEAKHYVLTNGGTVVFDEPMTEFQHYIISGSALVGGSLMHQDTGVFMPAGTHNPVNQMIGLRKHSISNIGEGETRIFTLAYKVPRPAFRWAKSRSKNLLQVPSKHQTGMGYTQLFTEEEHAVMGALRFHAVDMQTHTGHTHKHTIDKKTGKRKGGRNPEEAVYILRGTGETLFEDIVKSVRPGSFCWTPEGGEHGIYNPTDDILQYICMEFIHHDECWTERGYQGEKELVKWT